MKLALTLTNQFSCLEQQQTDFTIETMRVIRKFLRQGSFLRIKAALINSHAQNE